jgi:uncharacterized membrane protein (DUF4010 family)
LLIIFLVLSVMALILWRRDRCVVSATPLENPSQLGVALTFGVIYSVILFAVAAARDLLGERGLYLVAAISGITDVDAITLSTARLVQTGSLDSSVAWRVVITATLSNIVAKAAMAAVLGGPKLVRQLALPVRTGVGRGCRHTVLVLGAQGDILPIDASGILCRISFRLGLVQPGPKRFHRRRRQ